MSRESLFERARELDGRDPLAEFRARFVVAEPSLIYLDGNSLGRLTLAGQQAARRCLDHEWGNRLVRAWNEGWYELPFTVGDAIAPLIGAERGSVVVSDSTTVNLYKLASAALAARPDELHAGQAPLDPVVEPQLDLRGGRVHHGPCRGRRGDQEGMRTEARRSGHGEDGGHDQRQSSSTRCVGSS